MAKLEIVIYPHPALRKKASTIEINAEAKKLANDMLETMYSGKGIGLAAPQVGISTRLVIIDIEQAEGGTKGKPIVLFNPNVVIGEGEIEWDEGCLSLPGLLVKMRRKENVTVEYQDENGEVQKIEAQGLLAVALQHEIDHLDARLLIDYISEVQLDLYLKELKKLCKQK